MAEQKQETLQRIWLQWYGDGDPEIETGSVSEGDVTWCRDKIFEGDIPYVPESELARVRRETWEAAIRIAQGWATSPSCNEEHTDNPCCHVRTGAGIADALQKAAYDGHIAFEKTGTNFQQMDAGLDAVTAAYLDNYRSVSPDVAKGVILKLHAQLNSLIEQRQKWLTWADDLTGNQHYLASKMRTEIFQRLRAARDESEGAVRKLDESVSDFKQRVVEAVRAFPAEANRAWIIRAIESLPVGKEADTDEK